MNRRSTSTHRGLTLVETVAALSILSILLVACGSVVMLAERAVNDPTAKTAAQLQAADGLAQMADDLTVATNFTQRQDTRVTFTVPDRLATGNPQAVTYAWSGTAGDPLTRSFNGGAATAIVPAVRSCTFNYLTRTLGPAPGPAEQIIAYHDTVIGTAKDYPMTDKNWAAQSFTPSLPLGTATWTLTRLRLVMKTTGPIDQAISVSVTLPDLAGHPTTVLATSTVYKSAESTAYEWVDIPFTGLSGLNPAQQLCIEIQPSGSGKDAGAMQYDSSLLNLLNGANWSTTSNSGSSWNTGLGTSCARFYVIGTVP